MTEREQWEQHRILVERLIAFDPPAMSKLYVDAVRAAVSRIDQLERERDTAQLEAAAMCQAMDMQEKRETEEFHIPQASAKAIWDAAKSGTAGHDLLAELDRLRAENAKLKIALEPFASLESTFPSARALLPDSYCRAARAALAGPSTGTGT